MVLEELVEKLLIASRAADRASRDMRIDFLRRRNIDDGIDHLLGDVGDGVGPARRCRPRRQDEDRSRECGDSGAVQHELGETRVEKWRDINVSAPWLRLGICIRLWGKYSTAKCPVSQRTQGHNLPDRLLAAGLGGKATRRRPCRMNSFEFASPAKGGIAKA